MARLCERPGCSQAAEVCYGIDAEHLLVWLEAFDGVGGYRAGVLCRRHADAMVVPLGWMLDDRREAVPRLFKTREEPAAAPREKRRRVRSSGDETGALQLDIPLPLEEEFVAEPVPVAAPDLVVESVPAVEAPPAAEVTPWEPSFDTTSDRAGLGEARSPLLSRAFGRRSNRDAGDAPDGDGDSGGAV
ncbi:MAG: hypothetical protein RLZ04_1227 [Actinomycetota bacterium]|jgi:hypothetical protein